LKDWRRGARLRRGSLKFDAGGLPVAKKHGT
jgi:hypothetical protein